MLQVDERILRNNFWIIYFIPLFLRLASWESHDVLLWFQACDLFLKNHSAMIKYNIRQLKIEGATTLYIRRLCEVFFSSIMETGHEFMKAFPEHFACFSGTWHHFALRQTFFIEFIILVIVIDIWCHHCDCHLLSSL